MKNTKQDQNLQCYTVVEMDGWDRFDGWMDGWVDGRMDRQLDKIHIPLDPPTCLSLLIS